MRSLLKKGEEKILKSILKPAAPSNAKPITKSILYNIIIMLFFDAIDKKAKELSLCSIFIITRRYKIVEIRQ